MSRHRVRSPVNWPGNHFDASARRKVIVSPTSIHHARNNQETVNLIQCHQTRSLSEEQLIVQTVPDVVNSVVVNHAHVVKGQPQKKGVIPAVIRCQLLKYVNIVSCVNQLSFVKHVPNVQTLALDVPVVLVPKPNNRWRSILDLRNLNKFLKAENSKWRHQKE